MKISVIIPVYNVSTWIDTCMESLASQTFEDFEVILVNDGSTDDSEEKCRAWERKDSRFKLICQSNAGPSAARNNGIKAAKGEYLSFVDSDDWVDKDFLKKLLEAALEQGADIAECDVYRVDDRTGEKVYRSCSGSMGVAYEKMEHMKYGYNAIWKCLFKRELFTDYQVEFPNCHSEAKAIYPLLLALSKKTVNVTEPLYYYRRFRENSLTAKPRKNNGDELAIGLRAFDALLEGFQKNNIFEPYKTLLEEIVKYKLSDMLAMSFYRRDKEEYLSLVKSYRAYITRKFPNAENRSYITLGGYNLNRVLWSMNMLHDSYCRFNFSSLISIMNPLPMEVAFSHKNGYRKIMVARDLYGTFWEVARETNPRYIIMDFIEERFDIIKYGDVYITKSDAWDSGEAEMEDVELISRNSPACRQLWMESCKAFIARLKEEFPGTDVILVKNYLCESYGDIWNTQLYENVDEIRITNRILQEYYDFFQENCEGTMVMEASEIQPYVTDIDYDYGRIPSHLNDIVNRKIAAEIERIFT